MVKKVSFINDINILMENFKTFTGILGYGIGGIDKLTPNEIKLLEELKTINIEDYWINFQQKGELSLIEHNNMLNNTRFNELLFINCIQLFFARKQHEYDMLQRVNEGILKNENLSNVDNILYSNVAERAIALGIRYLYNYINHLNFWNVNGLSTNTGSMFEYGDEYNIYKFGQCVNILQMYMTILIYNSQERDTQITINSRKGKSKQSTTIINNYIHEALNSGITEQLDIGKYVLNKLFNNNYKMKRYGYERFSNYWKSEYGGSQNSIYKQTILPKIQEITKAINTK